DERPAVDAEVVVEAVPALRADQDAGPRRVEELVAGGAPEVWTAERRVADEAAGLGWGPRGRGAVRAARVTDGELVGAEVGDPGAEAEQGSPGRRLCASLGDLIRVDVRAWAVEMDVVDLGCEVRPGGRRGDAGEEHDRDGEPRHVR